MKEALYREFARYYDKIYSYKNYQKEVDFIDKILKVSNPNAKSILDVACGTGNHVKFLMKKGYSVVGLDKNPAVLAIARKKMPNVPFKLADMRRFGMKKRFDAVICMFTSINYVTDSRGLTRTLENFKKHLKQKGVVVFDFPLPGKHLLQGEFLDKDSAVVYDREDEGRYSNIVIYWMFKKRGKVSVVKDYHNLRLYDLNDISKIIKGAGFEHRVYWDFSLIKRRGRRPVIVCALNG